MNNVTATALQGVTNYGVYNDSSSSPTMNYVTIDASGGSTSNYGVYNYGSSPTMTNVIATALGASSVEGSSSYGVYNYGSSPTMTNVTITASSSQYFPGAGCNLPQCLSYNSS